MNFESLTFEMVRPYFNLKFIVLYCKAGLPAPEPGEFEISQKEKENI